VEYMKNGFTLRFVQRSGYEGGQIALATGNANFVLMWVPEELENTLKNILEKTCCKRSTRKNMQDRAIDWYFETVSRLHSANKLTLYPCLKPGGRDESPIVPKVERAIETGNFEEIIGMIPNTYAADVRERFNHVMGKRNYDVNNSADGRAYVSAVIDFVAYVQKLCTCIPGEEGRV
jgi:hypothetical protein